MEKEYVHWNATTRIHTEWTHSNPRRPTQISTLMQVDQYTRRSYELALRSFYDRQRETRPAKDIGME